MFRFEHPGFFWTAILLALCLLALAGRHYLLARDKLRWGTAASNRRLQPFGQPRSFAPVLLPAALLLLVAAAVNPQWGYRSVTVENTSADIYLLLDISSSMLAEDIPPSRLDKAKRFAADFSTAFGADKIGLIFFAGSAYLQSPLTTDRAAIQLFLNAAHPEQAGTQGTAIGDAIRLAIRSQGTPGQARGALILITDGEDHDSEALAAVAEAGSAGWTTYVVGAGTETGGFIPVITQGIKDVKRDASGQPVRTAINRSLMESLAEAGKGLYFELSNNAAVIDRLKQELAGLERSIREKRTFSEHRSYFQWFLLPGMIILLALPFVYYRSEVI